jgi:hypothetical protein
VLRKDQIGIGMSKEKELGTMIVVVLKARNLNDKHSFYKQDVFAQVSLNGMNQYFLMWLLTITIGLG